MKPKTQSKPKRTLPNLCSETDKNTADHRTVTLVKGDYKQGGV